MLIFANPFTLLGELVKRALLYLGVLLGHAAAMSMALLPVVWPVMEARAAEIRIDPTAPRGQRPTLSRSSWGRPVVNIVAPKAGISHNRFRELSASRGIIFNNSTSSGWSKTGGYVRANANLARSGPARVILNEVRGRNASRLRGNIEVFGRRAQLIIANENGVHCDGCNFVNTSSTVLSTGRPRVLPGGRVRLDVRRGVASVWRYGLRSAAPVKIIGRHVVVGGRVDSRGRVVLSGGAHSYDLATDKVAAIAGGRRTAPYAVDVMRRGSVRGAEVIVRGNEAGLGVQLDGYLQSAGRMQLVSSAWMDVGRFKAGGGVELRAVDDLRLHGSQMEAGGDVRISSRSLSLVSGTKLSAGGDVTIEARKDVDVQGLLQGRGIRVTSAGQVRNFGSILSNTSLEISAAGILNSRKTRENYWRWRYAELYRYTWWMQWTIKRFPNSWYALYYKALLETPDRGLLRSVKVGDGGDIRGGDITLEARSEDVVNRGVVAARGTLRVTAARDVINEALQEKSLRCSWWWLSCGYVGGKVYSARLQAGRDLLVRAGRDVRSSRSFVHAGGLLSVQAGRNVLATAWLDRKRVRYKQWYWQWVLNNGWWWSLERRWRWAYRDVWRPGEALAGGRGIRINAGGRVDVRNINPGKGGVFSIVAGDDIRLSRDEKADALSYDVRSFTFRSARGGITIDQNVRSAGGIVISASRDIVHRDLVAQRDIYVRSAASSLSSKGRIVARGNVTLQARNDLTVGGLLRGGDVTLISDRGAVRMSRNVMAGNDLLVSAGSDIFADGVQLRAQRDMILAAGRNIYLRSRLLKGESRHDSYSGRKHAREVWRTEYRRRVARSSLVAGRDLRLVAGGDIQLRATVAQAGRALDISAGGSILGDTLQQAYRGTQTTRNWWRERYSYWTLTWRRYDSWWGSWWWWGWERRTAYRWRHRDRRQELKGTRTLYNALKGGTVRITAGRDIALTGPDLQARLAVLTARGGNLSLAGFDDFDKVDRVELNTPGVLKLHADRLDVSRVRWSGFRGLDLGGTIDFGSRDVRFGGLSLFANRGTLKAASFDITAARIAGNGSWQATGAVRLQATSGDVQTGAIRAQSITLLADRGSVNAGAALNAERDVLIQARRNVTLAGLGAENAYVTASTGTISLRAGSEEPGSGGGSGLAGALANVALSASSAGLARSGIYRVRDQLLLDSGGDLKIGEGIALRSGGNMVLRSGGTLTIESLLRGETFKATRIEAGGDLALNARRSIINRGGMVSAAGNMLINAGDDVRNEAVRRTYEISGGYTAIAFEQGSMRAGNGLIIRAGRDVINRGSQLVGDGFVRIDAARDIVTEGLSDKYTYLYQRYSYTRGSWLWKRRYYVYRHFERAVLSPGLIQSARGDVTLGAGRDFRLTGGLISAAGDLTINAAGNVELLTDYEEVKQINSVSRSSSIFGIKVGKSSYDARWNDFAIMNAGLKGRNVRLYAGGSLKAQGAVLHAKRNIELSVVGDVSILPQVYDRYRYVKSKSSSFFGLFTKTRDFTSQQRLVEGTQLTTDKDISLTSETGSVILRAARLKAGRNIDLSAPQGIVYLGSETASEFVQEKTYSQNPVWWKSRDKGHYIESVVHTHLLAGGKIRINAGKGVIVEYQEKPGRTMEEAVRELSRVPELAWMGQVLQRNDVFFRSIAVEAQNWDYKAQGLTQGAAAFIMLAVTMATQGMGSALFGVAGNTVLGSALNAGFSQLVGRATVSLINNQGDIGAVLKELGSSDTIKSLATSMLTAGLSAGISQAFPDLIPQAPAGMELSAPKMLQANLVRNLIGVGVRTAVYGTDNLKPDLANALLSAAVDTIGSQATIAIGQAAANGDLHQSLQLLAHAAIGCATGVAGSALSGGAGRGCASNAIGQTVGHITADWLRDRLLAGDFETLRTLGERGVIDSSRLAAAFAAMLVGADVNMAANAGGRAAEYNSLGLLKRAYKLARLAVRKFANKQEITTQDILDIIGSAEDLQTLVSGDATAQERLVSAVMLAIDWWLPIPDSWRDKIASKLKQAIIDNKRLYPPKNLKACPGKADCYIYISRRDDGTIQYVGITNDFDRRAKEHWRQKGIKIELLFDTKFTREDARAVEQALIEIYGLEKNGGSLINKINSISPNNPKYPDQIKRGYEILRDFGYRR